MFGAIASFIGGLFGPAEKLIDTVSTTDEERLTLRNEHEKIKADVEKKLIEYHTTVAELQAKLMEESAKVQVAETKSDSAFTRLYRPIIITGLFVLMCLNSFGVLKVPLPEIFVQVFGAAFGVLSVGRSIEKVKRIKK